MVLQPWPHRCGATPPRRCRILRAVEHIYVAAAAHVTSTISPICALVSMRSCPRQASRNEIVQYNRLPCESDCGRAVAARCHAETFRNTSHTPYLNSMAPSPIRSSTPTHGMPIPADAYTAKHQLHLLTSSDCRSCGALSARAAEPLALAG